MDLASDSMRDEIGQIFFPARADVVRPYQIANRTGKIRDQPNDE